MAIHLKPTLITIKIIHTSIWIVMAFSVMYVLYSGLSGNVTLLSWVCTWMIVLEGGALLIGKGDCPLHIYAQKIAKEEVLNDTFLPSWIFFRGYKVVFTILFLIGVIRMIVINF